MILGFNAFMRDAAAALVDGGSTLGAVEEERLSRIKHTGAFPERAIAWCLADAGVRVSDLDGVAFNMRPLEALPGRIRQVVQGFPRTMAFGSTRGGDFARMCLAGERFAERFGRPRDFHWVRHHDAHAASAFLASEFEEAAVLVVDGSGELASTTLYRGSGALLTQLEAEDFPNSLGYFYSALTEWLGFTPASDEGTTMGLSSYGRPDARLLTHFRAMISDRGRIDRRWFVFQDGGRGYYGVPWVRAFGRPRAPGEAMEPRHQDVAAAGQRRLEEMVLARTPLLRWRQGR